jgi:hypothetical protein
MKLLGGVLLVAGLAVANDNATLSRRVGIYSVSLRPPATGLIAGEEVQIEFRVTDATQADPLMGPLAIVRAKVETQIDMPEMPSMPKQIETAHPEGVPGDYGIHPTFPHGGTYRLKMEIHPPAGEQFTVEFPLEVQDAGSTAARRAIKPRFWLELNSDPKTPKADEPAKLRLEIRERDNPRAAYKNFETVHEKLMHLIVVSKDLGYFRHEHPEIGPDGAFVLNHSFPFPGEYHLFADVAPRGAGSQIMFAKLKAGGKATRAAVSNAALTLSAEAGPTLLEIAPAESPVETGKTKIIPVLFRNASDKTPVTDLENYLGAKAHLILIHEDALTFVHSHPDEREGQVQPGRVPFLVRLPKPGTYRAWLQFVRAGGTVQTAQFQISAGAR